MSANLKFRKSAIAAAVASVGFSAWLANPAIAQEQAQDEAEGLERIMVTATRRINDVQDIPVNITAMSAEKLKDNQIDDLTDLSNWVPGLTVLEQGSRSGSPIVVRGLSTDATGPGDNSGGGTVATYVGEIPLYVDLNLTDMDRIEVLLGPQGTLYGAGTLGGAIRYIPKKPRFDEQSLEVHAGLSQTKESDDFNYKMGFVFNTAINDQLAFRMSVDTQDDAGFLDYNYVVRQGGVSNPQPDFSDPDDVAANLMQYKDKNGQEVLSGRWALRFAPTDEVDATLTYYYQKRDSEGRSVVHTKSFGSGPYENAYRYLEPKETKNELLTLEVIADLGFAELTSATGYSEYTGEGQRDQTDLLLWFEYSYETFPSFSAYTRELEFERTFTQELRLVSLDDGPISWIAGAFYNRYYEFSTSEEFVPGLGDYWGVNRPDALEYYSQLEETMEEMAIFGEITYAVNDQLDITVGGRFYNFEDDVTQGFDLPFLYTLFGDYDPYALWPDLQNNVVDDDGTLFKINASYDVSDDIMVYATLSEGYRIGGVNSVTPCPPDVANSQEQNLCALPDEVLIKPDQTTNYELGIHSTWLNNTLELNGAVYYMDWTDVQVAGTTEYGELPITVNAGAAEATGFELSSRYLLNEQLTVHGSITYNKAQLTKDADVVQGSEIARAGDRLPGTPETKINGGITYNTSWNSFDVKLTYGFSYIGNILTNVGADRKVADSVNIYGQWDDQNPVLVLSPYYVGYGETLGDYTLHNVSATFTADNWDVTFFIKNLTDTYAHTSMRSNGSRLYSVNDFALRSNAYYVNTPRTIGAEISYSF